jgi:hypothetical protein
LKEKRDLYFLRKIAEKACICSLIIEIGGQKFEASPILNGMEFVHVASQECIGTNSMLILGNFLAEHSTRPLPPSDELYLNVVQETMRSAMSESVGVTRFDMETLIGSLIEYWPDDVERYMMLLKGI